MTQETPLSGSLLDRLQGLRETALTDIANADSLTTLDEIRVEVVGRNKGLNEILRAMKDADASERPIIGKTANEVKQQVTEAIDAKRATLEVAARAEQTDAERVDISLPGRKLPIGHVHPVSQITEELVQIFGQLGFQVATGPEIETEYYNFDALNTPEDHPARDSHDTFYVNPGRVLRTHTSPVQMRVMEKHEPPVAVIVPGRVYRCDYDATHSPMFFQIEGLLVDKGVTFADLKGTIEHFIRTFFGPDTKMRFRPHYFPFTEPSAEVDILWTAKDRHTGETKSQWLEILGCGMVHPNVFKHAGYDYETYSGFAFGMGIDRMAMVRYGINNIHLMYENDLRFLEQF